jgi:hypothetical protein
MIVPLAEKRKGLGIYPYPKYCMTERLVNVTQVFGILGRLSGAVTSGESGHEERPLCQIYMEEKKTSASPVETVECLWIREEFDRSMRCHKCRFKISSKPRAH